MRHTEKRSGSTATTVKLTPSMAIQPLGTSNGRYRWRSARSKESTRDEADKALVSPLVSPLGARDLAIASDQRAPRVHAYGSVGEPHKDFAVVGAAADLVDSPDDIDVPADVVPTHLVADAQRALHVDAVADRERAERRAQERLFHAYKLHEHVLVCGPRYRTRAHTHARTHACRCQRHCATSSPGVPPPTCTPGYPAR